jgi:hypothetical protein
MQLSSEETMTLRLRTRSFQLVLADQRVQGALIATSRFDLPRFIVCPCCGYPTLTIRGYDTCPICSWEDDGQDDADADDVRGGPNSDYSLTEARLNFASHRTQYRAEDRSRFDQEAKTASERRAIVAAYDALLPDLRPWTFISALARMNELHVVLHERRFGKRRVRRWRAIEGDERRRADRDWEVWTALFSGIFPRWLRFEAPPTIRSQRSRRFDRFAERVWRRLLKQPGRNALVTKHHRRGSYVCWSSLDREVWLTHGSDDVRVTCEPYSEERLEPTFRLADDDEVERAAGFIGAYFAVE